MKQNLINDVIQEMIPHLNNAQAEKLQTVLQHTLFNYEIVESENKDNSSEQNLVELFLSAKRIEGCSEKSLKYYLATIQSMLDEIGKPIKHIQTDDIRNYLTEYQVRKKSSRVTIDNEALFVTLKAPYNRLKIGGIETRLREFGKQLGLNKVHPHKFRRTLATMAIDKGMPIEQLQQLLGHRKIDTTLQYAMVKQSNVKIAHRKYIG